MEQYTLEELTNRLHNTLASLDGKDVAELINPLLGSNLVYVGDGIWEEDAVATVENAYWEATRPSDEDENPDEDDYIVKIKNRK